VHREHDVALMEETKRAQVEKLLVVPQLLSPLEQHEDESGAAHRSESAADYDQRD
jgi:hypothetical protein